jgi:hypothetical protein
VLPAVPPPWFPAASAFLRGLSTRWETAAKLEVIFAQGSAGGRQFLLCCFQERLESPGGRPHPCGMLG